MLELVCGRPAGRVVIVTADASGRRFDDRNHKRDLRRVTTQDMESAANNPELIDVA